GLSFYHARENLSFELRGSYAQTTDKSLVLADSGRIYLEYAEAAQAALDLEGSYQPIQSLRILCVGSLKSAHEKGSSTQLPMVPAFQLRSRVEIDLQIPLSLWSSIEF